jgi:hypothetical protein
LQACYVCRFDFWKSDEGIRLAVLLDEDYENREKVVQEESRDVQSVQNHDEIKSPNSIEIVDSDVSSI